MNVPEEHPISGAEYHEREDDAHVLKVSVIFKAYGHSQYTPSRHTDLL